LFPEPVCGWQAISEHNFSSRKISIGKRHGAKLNFLISQKDTYAIYLAFFGFKKRNNMKEQNFLKSITALTCRRILFKGSLNYFNFIRDIF
jgi:hypothetical protein